MSLINQLHATTEYFWLQTEPVDILNKASALVWRLMGNAITQDNWEVQPHEMVDGGKMVKVPLEYANSHRGGYGAATVIEAMGAGKTSAEAIDRYLQNSSKPSEEISHMNKERQSR